MMESMKIKETRKVGPGLLLGIALVPVVFTWFLLRPGYTMLARVTGFLWLALSISLAAMVDEIPSASPPKVEVPGDPQGDAAKASKSPAALPGAAQPGDR